MPVFADNLQITPSANTVNRVGNPEIMAKLLARVTGKVGLSTEIVGNSEGASASTKGTAFDFSLLPSAQRSTMK